MVRDREGAPANVRRGEVTLAGADDEVIQAVRGSEEIPRLNVAQHRNDQSALLQRRSHADVHGFENFESRIGPTAVCLRHSAESIDCRLEKVRCECEGYSATCELIAVL